MVYCGKASQGCKNCRIRRIKCDKVRPECSQCIRVGKKCPGYRDQLSLMFRDESSKVIQKAHAQWGVSESEDSQSSSSASSSAAPSSSTSPYAVTSSRFPVLLNQQQVSPRNPVSPGEWSSSAVPLSSLVHSNDQWPIRICTPIMPTIEEQGVKFFVDRYVIGHPDEVKSPQDLSQVQWLGSPALQDIMIAVGVASMSNLQGDESMMMTARQKYGQALRRVGALIKTPTPAEFDVTMKAVVMLGMFEIVKGTQHNVEVTHAHVLGGIALLRSWCPIPNVPFGGVRSLVQLCYCMFIPAHAAGRPLPAPFYEWVSFSRSLLDPMDYPTTDLGLLIARFVDLSAYIRAEPPKGKRISAVHQLLELDAAFEDWEAGLTSVWPYRTESARHLPPAAVFNGEYHVYYDMWTARMWMHYRWARILTNQTIVDLADQQPRSSPPLLLAAQYQRCLNIIRQQARETLVSIPSHWRHPLLDKQKSTMPVEKSGGAGSGAAGIPVVLFQLKVAACAPGLPAAYWDWAYGVMECIWGDLGMVHAKNMMDGMVAERDARYQFRTESSSSPPEQRMTSL